MTVLLCIYVLSTAITAYTIYHDLDSFPEPFPKVFSLDFVIIVLWATLPVLNTIVALGFINQVLDLLKESRDRFKRNNYD